MREIEKLLKRKLKKTEEMLYQLQKDNKDYHFEIDKNGNLISVKNN